MKQLIDEELLTDTILKDNLIREYNIKKCQIYSKSKCKINFINSELIVIWPEEVNKLVTEIDKLIDLRIEKIKQYYSEI